MTKLFDAYITDNKDNSKTLYVPAFDLYVTGFKTIELIHQMQHLLECEAYELKVANKLLPDVPEDFHPKRTDIHTYIEVQIREKEENINEEDTSNSNPWSCNENVFEFLRNEKIVSATITQGRYINKVREYAKTYPDDFKIIKENIDGSIFVKFPTKYLNITRRPDREYSEEELNILRERLSGVRLKKQKEIEEHL